MPSPFPGMDPWLESSAVWHGFHEKLIVKTVEVMQPDLRRRGYYIDIGERLWLAKPGRGIFPDDVILRNPAHSTSVTESGETVAVAEPVRIARSEVEVREGYIEIYDVLNHEIITGIEFLSPSNKRNSEGRELYRRKQQEVRQANINLVEIDFHRRGPHVLDVPEDVVEALRPWCYLANLVRRDTDEYQFYPIQLREPLPTIRIPLKPDDEDARLNLQEVFTRCYDLGPYPERINYAADPPPPELDPEDAKWADELLREKGFRGESGERRAESGKRKSVTDCE